MALRARAKQVAAGLDRRFPLFRDLIRKSRLVRKLLKTSRLADPRLLRTHVGFFPLPPTHGIPKFVKFHPEACGERVHVLFGVTHDDPALHALQANVVFADAHDDVVLRLQSAFVTQAPVTPPWALRALLPECVYWYERRIDDLPPGWYSLNVRFNSSAALPGPAELPPRFRFHCVLAHGMGEDADARIIDLRHCGPYALGTQKGDA